jgi:hypothetical protein
MRSLTSSAIPSPLSIILTTTHEVDCDVGLSPWLEAVPSPVGVSGATPEQLGVAALLAWAQNSALAAKQHAIASKELPVEVPNG